MTGQELALRLRQARNAAGLTQAQAARAIGRPPQTLGGWENARSQPDVGALTALMRLYRVNAAAFLGLEAETFTLAEVRMLQRYRALDEHGRRMADLTLEEETRRLREETARAARRAQPARPARAPQAEIEAQNLLAFRVSDQPAAAGTGVYLGPECFHTVYVNAQALPRGAAFGVPVRGDSMEPVYHDGDILVVSGEQPRCGEVGVFTLDGSGYVKKLGEGVLLSLNPAYAPIPMDESIRCNGKVIGVLSPRDVDAE